MLSWRAGNNHRLRSVTVPMTTKAKRARQKKNRLEKLARLAEEAAAHADDDVPEPEQKPSEVAAAQVALGATKRFRKKLKSE